MLVASAAAVAPCRSPASSSIQLRVALHSFATMCLSTLSISSSDTDDDATPSHVVASMPSDATTATVLPLKTSNAALSLLLPPYSAKRSLLFVLVFCVVILPTLMYTFHPGLRRTIQFWTAMAPLVAEHKLIKLRNRVGRWRVLRVLRRNEQDDDDDIRNYTQQREKERIKAFHRRAAPRITKRMVDLGGIYVKLGQVLSTVGSGFLDEAYIEALKPLQDGVPPRPYDQIATIIESSTGQAMETLFEDFDERPIGAASIGQAHRAVLKGTNEQVIVKVQYPEVSRLFQIDFDNMETAVKWLDPSNTKLVDALRKRHENELDFGREADNLRTIRGNLQRHGVEPTLVRVPIVKNETGICTDNVLVMEYLQGTSLSSAMEQEQTRFARALGQEDAQELKAVLMKRMKEHMEHGGGAAGTGTLQMMGGGRTKLLQAVGPTAARLFRAFAGVKEHFDNAALSVQTAGARARHLLFRRSVDHAPITRTNKQKSKSRFNLGRAIKTLVHVHGLQMIKDGVFNLDCHGGNVLILPDGRLGLLDYGMVGRFNDEDRIRLAETVMALARKDKEEVARIYTDAGYRASWKEGNVTDANILHRFASFHFDRIDLSDVALSHRSTDGTARKVGVMEILRTTRERSIPFWIEDGRRLGGLLIGTASQAARPISLANEWRPIAAQVVTRKQRTKKAPQKQQ